MDSIISLGQKNTLAEYMILSGADNRPPMLDKDLYDSWKSRMELYMQNREHGRMILESVENGPLIWPTVEENGVIRTKKYAELSAAEKIQADCDMKATNIILQGLPADIYSLVNHHRVAKDLWERVQLLMQGTSLTKQERECKLYDAFDKFTHIKGESLHTYYLRFTQLINDMNIYKMKMEQFQVNTKFLNSLPPEWSFVVPVFSPGDDPIACLNKAMAFLTTVASSRFPSTNNQLRTSSNPRNQATIQDDKARVVKCYNCQGEGHMARQCTQPKRPRNAAWYKEKAMLAEAQEAGQILDEEQLAFLADLGIPAGQAQTIIPHNAAFQTEDLDTYDSVKISRGHKADFEQSPVMDFTDNEISSDSNVIPYSQYLQETQQATEKANKEQNNETITTELERYKERVKTFEQRLNIDLSSHEKMIDSQIDDMIRDKLALKEQVGSLEQNLSKQIKEKESVLQAFAVFKNESKEKENKYMENEIDLEKKIKELDNIICKVGYQNSFYLKKAQWIKPTLYDGVVMSNTHVVMHVIDDEETLILEEESRSKMSEKAKDPEVFKDQFDSIKQTRVRHKEQSDSLINKLNLKSVEYEDLKAQIQDKVFVIISLKNDLLKLKRKEIVEHVVHTPSATTIAPGMFKLNLVPLPPRVQDTCPNKITPSTKKVAVSPMNKVKKVRFAEPLTSSSNIKQVESSNTSDSNTPVLSSTGVKCSTSNCGSKPPGNKRNDRISQTPSRTRRIK
ncbi:retrovirus-related pol polyprotein from transposon TNT 1-94 [Tanacetum coccineum]|uniref:Retrovirus-related pol polyprotein from transposon TNT 1-94 n=1 Tax=Tanacetum coccineum TaxID=301880 RepID=A0ABQ5J6Q7_9ASTR